MKNIKEFSKTVVIALTLVWFITVIFAFIIVWKSPELLNDLLIFVGTPMSAGLLGYLLKSAFENREKIRKGVKQCDNSKLYPDGDNQQKGV